MTSEQKIMIEEYRKNGIGYKQIVKDIGISVNSVKTYCRRNNLCSEDLQKSVSDSVCEQCGKIVVQRKGKKHKRFCSDRCRNKWWNAHLDQVKRKANYEYVCPVCEKVFKVYGNSKRKYCSHNCYIKGRFGGASDV